MATSRFSLPVDVCSMVIFWLKFVAGFGLVHFLSFFFFNFIIDNYWQDALYAVWTLKDPFCPVNTEICSFIVCNTMRDCLYETEG